MSLKAPVPNKSANAAVLDEYFRVCSKSDMKSVECLFDGLNQQEIESIRDAHKAR